MSNERPIKKPGRSGGSLPFRPYGRESGQDAWKTDGVYFLRTTGSILL